jgi:hypothetical protein
MIKYCPVLKKSEPGGIQTPNLLIRSQMLYSVKLQAHFVSLTTKR